MSRWIKDLLSCDSGATAIEYGLIAGGVALVIIGALTLVGGELAAFFQSLAGSP